jgi:hypothetical protein
LTAFAWRPHHHLQTNIPLVAVNAKQRHPEMEDGFSTRRLNFAESTGRLQEADPQHLQNGVDSDVPLDTALLKFLAINYLDAHVACLNTVRQRLSRRYTYVGNFNQTQYQENEPDILSIRGSLSVPCVNKILREMCKNGTMHDDMRIILQISLEAPNHDSSLLTFMFRDYSLEPMPSIVCEADVKIFKRATEQWARRNTSTLTFPIRVEDLKPESLRFFGACDNLVTFFRSRHCGERRAETRPPSSSANNESSSGESDNCGICFEPLLFGVIEVQQPICNMRCGHAMLDMLFQSSSFHGSEHLSPLPATH